MPELQSFSRMNCHKCHLVTVVGLFGVSIGQQRDILQKCRKGGTFARLLLLAGKFFYGIQQFLDIFVFGNVPGGPRVKKILEHSGC